MPAIPPEPTDEEKIPLKARELLATHKIEQIRQEYETEHTADQSPDEWWQWIPAVLGMPVEHGVPQSRSRPWATLTLALAVTLISSAVAIFDAPAAIQAFGLIPSMLWRYGGATLLTSFFLHVGAMHLLGNMYFFLIFGDNVEEWLGTWKFILLLLCATLAGGFLHALGDPRSMTPCVGASGGISGIIAFYALKFPRAKLGLLFHYFVHFRWIRVPAFALFILWLVMQGFGARSQLSGVSNVSSLAHLGGAAVGFLFWLITRNK